MRIDKWLWAARFFKTRCLAAKACELGRIEIRELAAKPSREIKPGDFVQIKNATVTTTVLVLGLSEIRGPAPVAQLLYRETEESRALRELRKEEKNASPQFDFEYGGKPSKKDRRRIQRLRGW